MALFETKPEKDKKRILVKDLLKAYPEGFTIQDIMDKTKLARHTVLARLHRLEGEGLVKMRQVNMAKLYSWAHVDYDVSKDGIKLIPLEEKHLARKPRGEKKPKKEELDIKSLKEKINKAMGNGELKKHEAQIQKQRSPISHAVRHVKKTKRKKVVEFIRTGIPGFDELFEDGIPKGTSTLVAGGAGSGKTVFCLQTVYNHASHGDKCLYMSFEESEGRLIDHMKDFGWDPDKIIKKGNLLIKRFNPFEITRSVDALLMKAKGELLIDVEPIIFPNHFKPDIIVVDSLTAIASAFTGKDDSYRIYVEQLFLFFEKIGATAFLITETEQIPKIFSSTGVEEFLADGVVVLYNIKRGNVRENAIEVLKLRGAKHEKKIVAMQITDDGIIVYPEQEVFGGMGE